MTPQQKLKHLILNKSAEFGAIKLGEVTAENVDALYDEYEASGDIQDAKYEVRCSGTETGLQCDWSRHYESNAVAAKMPDGSWVGWTYCYFGRWNENGRMAVREAVIEFLDEQYPVKREGE